MLTYRNSTQALHTGFAVESTEGTPATLTSANFVGDWNSSLIVPKFTTQEVKVGGFTGTDKIVTSKYLGELSSFKLPMSNGVEGPILQAGGAYKQGSSYLFGGSIYSAISGSDKGRISTTSLTFVQYDGKEAYTLAGARPTSLKFGGKAGEVIYVEAGLNGNWSKTVSNIAYFQQPTSAFNTNILKGSSLSLSGTFFDYTDIEVDLKPKTNAIESAASSTGYVGFEAIDIDPTITIGVYPGDPTAKDLWNMFLGSAVIPFSWSFGSGTGNTYTITANLQISSQESSYNNDVQQRKLVLKPVYNPAQNYKLSIAVA